MLSATELWYRAKKLYSLYPGVVAPVSGGFLAGHYARRRRERGLLRAGLDALIGLAFLAWVPVRARAVQRNYGFDAAWRERTIKIARAAFADPNDIALFRIDHVSQLDSYIRRFEDAGLNKRINPRAWEAGCVLADKIAFYARCAAYGLHHPQVVATIVDGHVEVLGAPTGRALLLKPARGEGGAGVAFLDGAPEAAAAFSDWLRAHFGRRRHAWLVQERIVPHPALADLA
jgi:glutathione synthase/RimK-type ligase-like ATP-grasp enzyme